MTLATSDSGISLGLVEAWFTSAFYFLLPTTFQEDRECPDFRRYLV
jgi:hypothetical protein